MDAVVNILHHDKPDEIFMFPLVVKGKAHQRANGLDRVKMVKVQSGLNLVDAAIGLFQHGDIKPFLVREVVIDHPP